MTITFHDVSHFQGAYVPTGPTIAKATEGSTFTDSQYGGIRRRTLAGGWPFLPYHYLHHGGINAQVDHAFAVVGHQSLMLDVEVVTVGGVQQPVPELADTLAFIDRWHAVTGQRVTLAYIPHWFWAGFWHSPSLAGLTARGAGLISSLYGHGHADDGPGWAAYGGVTPAIWQYTSTPLDTNAFKGTTAQLAKLWADGTDGNTNPSQPVEDVMAIDPADVTTIVNALTNSAPFKDLAFRVDAMANMRPKFLGGTQVDKVVPFVAALDDIPTSAAPAAPPDATAIGVAVAEELDRRLDA